MKVDDIMNNNEERITNLLLKLGLRPDLAGFKYVVKAIDMILDNNLNKIPVMKLYQQIADYYNRSQENVERGIRESCKLSTKFANKEVFYNLFQYDYESTRRSMKPSMFLYTVATYLFYNPNLN